MNVRRGEIYWVDLEPVKGSEQGGVRPCLVVQNDTSNLYSPLTIVASITSKIKSRKFATNVFLPENSAGLGKDSIILLNQLKTIDKRRIIKKVGMLDSETMRKIDFAIKISLGLEE